MMVVDTITQAQTPLTTAVDFTVTTTDGHQFKLFDTLNSGKYVCIDFFYTTCGPCQTAAPKVNQAYEHFGCNTSNVFFIGIDQGDNNAEVIAFHNTYGVHYPCVSGTQGNGDAVCSSYQITAYPTVILIAPNHNIVENDIWPINTYNDVVTPLAGHGCLPKACPSSSIEDGTQIAPSQIELVFPNPASDIVKLYFNLKDKEKVYFRIIDITGKIVYSAEETLMNQGRNSLSIPVQSVSPGLYFIQMILNGSAADIKTLSINR